MRSETVAWISVSYPEADGVLSSVEAGISMPVSPRLCLCQLGLRFYGHRPKVGVVAGVRGGFSIILITYSPLSFWLGTFHSLSILLGALPHSHFLIILQRGVNCPPHIFVTASHTCTLNGASTSLFARHVITTCQWRLGRVSFLLLRTSCDHHFANDVLVGRE